MVGDAYIIILWDIDMKVNFQIIKGKVMELNNIMEINYTKVRVFMKDNLKII